MTITNLKSGQQNDSLPWAQAETVNQMIDDFMADRRY